MKLGQVLGPIVLVLLAVVYAVSLHDNRASTLAAVQDPGDLPSRSASTVSPSSMPVGGVDGGQSFTPGPEGSPGSVSTSPPTLETSEGSGGVPIGTREEIDPGMFPTVDGLYSLTVEQFTDESFLQLTTERARRLLPVDETIPDLALPGRLDQALVGGLPTREDCERGFRSKRVQALLMAVQASDLTLADLDMTPDTRRTRSLQGKLIRLRAARDMYALELMQELDKTTAYHNWTLLWRLRQEWAR